MINTANKAPHSELSQDRQAVPQVDLSALVVPAHHAPQLEPVKMTAERFLSKHKEPTHIGKTTMYVTAA